MRKWPKRHRHLGVAALVLAIVLAGAYLFVVQPQARRVRVTESALEELRSDLKESGWPLDKQRLETLLANLEKKLNGPPGRRQDTARNAIGIKHKSRLVVRDATGMFQARIAQEFGTTEEFMDNVSRLYFETEYTELARRLEADGVILDGAVLNLDEDTSSPYNYQLVLQVWTVDALLGLALENHLVPIKNREVKVRLDENREVYASEVSVLPVRAYAVNRVDEEPYVLEFPVRMTVRGQLTDLCNFLRGLHSDGNFLPISRLEISTADYVTDRGLREGGLIVHRLEVTLECSAFFRLRPDLEAPRPPEEKVLPAGA